MEHPFSLHPIRRRPLATKKLAARTARRAARQALRFALLPPLPTIPDVEFLTPNSPKYDQYLAASNLRTTLRPALRALCKTGQSVAAVLDWVRTNGLPFAVRSETIEGELISLDVVADIRGTTSTFHVKTKDDVYKVTPDQDRTFLWLPGLCN